MNTQQPLRSRVRGHCGQSTAMVIVMLTVFMLFIALVANVGQAVNRRIALQVIADAGAYTGATKMAEGLNYIAWANGVIQDYWAFADDAWLAATIGTVADCDTYDSINSTFNSASDAMTAMIDVINLTYGGVFQPFGIVHGEAKRVSDYNAGDLFPGEKDAMSYAEYDFSTETGVIMPKRNYLYMMDLSRVDDGTDPKTSYPALPPLGSGSKQSYSQLCLKTVGFFKVPIVKSWDWNVWWKKSDSDTKYFVWIATAPASRLMIFDPFFGPNGMPQMKAAAAARPVGGSIVDAHPTYVAEMVPVKKVQTMSGYILDSMKAGFGGMRQVTH
jgi:hypothetical protein